MKITVVGTGYVGLVTGVCLAEHGNEVLCLDVNAATIDRLSRGELPFFEPGLADRFSTNLNARRLRFTTDTRSAIEHGDVVFIAVGTPPGENGEADVSQVEAVAENVAKYASGPKTIAIKSTVPPGTCKRIESRIPTATKHRIAVLSNPEFLKEGQAVDDFLRPDRIIVGADDPRDAAVLQQLFAPFVRNDHPILIVPRAASELIKYAANSYLAMRISFINQIAELCRALDVNVDDVRRGIGYDDRIGNKWLYPGLGYGGSCFPKDVPALVQIGRRAGLDMTLPAATHQINQRQPAILLNDARTYFDGSLRGRTFGIWGLAFKPQTDDIREAPALKIIDGLLKDGASVRAHDPRALLSLPVDLRGKITCCDEPYAALEGADGLFVCTEWNVFRSPDFPRIRAALRRPVIFDGRNLFTPDQMRQAGFDYFSIGRPPVRR